MLYGWRFVRALFFGAILFILTAWFIWPVSGDGLPPALSRSFYRGSVFFWGVSAFWMLAILAMLFVFRPLTCAIGRAIPAVWFTACIAGGLAFMIISIWSLWGLGSSIYTYAARSYDTPAEKLKAVLWMLGRYLWALTPVVVGALPATISYQLEKLRENPTFRRWFLEGKGGASRWAGPATFDRHDAYDIGVNYPLDHTIKGVYIGRTLFGDDHMGRDVVIKDDGHMLTIGQPGSGKSVTAIWPNLAMYDGSAIVIDPRAEHAQMFAGRRQADLGFGSDKKYVRHVEENMPDNLQHLEERRRQLREKGTDVFDLTRVRFRIPESRVFVLDPFGINGAYPSARYNPLSEIDINNQNARKLISAISGSCVTVSEGENKFWEESARLVLDGAIAHVLSTLPPEEHNLPAVADLLLGIDPVTGFADDDRLKETLIDMRMNRAAGGLPQQAAKLFDNLGEKAYGNITAELLNSLKWATDPAMRENLSRSDFTFASIGERKTTVFIALPLGNMVEQMRWLRTITEVSMRILEERTDASKQRVGRILYILDELPQYGAHLKAIKEGLVTLRAAGVKIWAFVQNIQQLTTCFGEDGAKNFQSGGTVQVFGVHDEDTAEYVTNRVGFHRVTDRKGILRRAAGDRMAELADAASVMQVLGKANDIQYVFRSGSPPMRLRRIAYKPLTIEGENFRGLPLDGYYDEHLLNRSAASRPVPDADRYAAPQPVVPVDDDTGRTPAREEWPREMENASTAEPAGARGHDYDEAYGRYLKKVRKLRSFAARVEYLRSLVEEAEGHRDANYCTGELAVCRDLVDALDMGLDLTDEQRRALEELSADVSGRYDAARERS